MGPALARLHHLLLAATHTDLEEQVLSAMSLYATGLLSVEIEQRLLTALVAVESLLIKDSKEKRIKDLLASRASKMLGRSSAERKQLRKHWNGYAIRSAFVHHGKRVRPEQIGTVNALVRDCWAVILTLLEKAPYATKAALLEELDRREAT